MRWALVLAVSAAPAFAETRMTSTDCTRGWQAFIDTIGGFITNPSQRATDEQALARAVPNAVFAPDGWCSVQGSDPGLAGAPFATLDWQADGLGPFIVGSGLLTGLRVRAAGVFVRPGSNQPYDVMVVLRRTPGNPVFFVDTLDMRDRSGAGFSASALVAGASFDALSQAVVSFGSLRLTDFSMIGDATPAVMADLAPDWTSASLRGALSRLDPDQIDPQSRIAGEAFIAALPRATGQLQATLKSDRGVGLMQVGMAAGRGAVMSLGDMIAFALSGARVSIGWQPH